MCVRLKQPSQGCQSTNTHTHTHTNLWDHLKKISLLCMGCVTPIEENIIEKHHTEEEGVYVENNAEPSLKTQSGQKCRSKPTASFQPQKRRLSFFWKSLCGNTRSPPPHLGSIYHWKQLQKISETLVSSRFPTNNLKEVEKDFPQKGKYRKYKKARDVTQCISRFSPAFRPLSCTPPCSLGTALTGVWVVASMTPGGIAGVCAVIFFVSAASSKKLKTKDSKHENIYSPLRRQSMKAWRDLSQKLSVTALSRMTNFAMVQNRDLKEEFAGNFAKQQRWLNNPTLNSVNLRIWEETA